MGAQLEAIELYENAQERGGWHQIGAWVRGRSARLLSLAEITANRTVISRHYLGMQHVPIEQIRGSEGRRTLFDDAFHPLDAQTRSRWISVATAWLQGISLPPVELIRVGELYFVRDGHHRISVARTIGLEEIEAVVTVWDIAAAPTPQSTTASKAPRAGMGRETVMQWGKSLRQAAHRIACHLQPEWGTTRLQKYTKHAAC